MIRYQLPIELVIRRKVTYYALRQQGIQTLQQLAYFSIEDLSLIPGIGQASAVQIYAKTRAYLLNQPYWIQPPPPSLIKHPIFIDIRVHPDYRPQLPWGFCWRKTAQTPQFIGIHPSQQYDFPLDEVRQIHFVPDVKTAWQWFNEQLASETEPIYYWGKVVTTHLQQTAPRPLQRQLKPKLVAPEGT